MCACLLFSSNQAAVFVSVTHNTVFFYYTTRYLILIRTKCPVALRYFRGHNQCLFDTSVLSSLSMTSVSGNLSSV